MSSGLYSSLNNPNTEAFLTAVDEYSLSVKRSIALFLRHPDGVNDSTVPAAESFGSGFFMKFDGSIFVITAAHVAKDSMKSDTIVKGFRDVKILNGTKAQFVYDDDADIAIACVDGLFSSDNCGTLPLTTFHEGFVETDLAIFVGAPETRNRINHAHNIYDFSVVSMTFRQREFKRKITNIKSPLYFNFTRRSMIPGMNMPESRFAPDPHGMSGGPVVKIQYNPKTKEVCGSLVGVSVEYNKENGVLIASDVSDMLWLFDYARKLPPITTK
jgi:Trypsin-like peptidase domain